MSNNIECLYLGVVQELGDSQIRVSVKKSFHTRCDLSTSTSLGKGKRKVSRPQQDRSAGLTGQTADGSRG